MSRELEQAIDSGMSRLASRLDVAPPPDVVARAVATALRENSLRAGRRSVTLARALGSIAAAVAIGGLWSAPGRPGLREQQAVEAEARLDQWLGAVDESARRVAESWSIEWDFDAEGAADDPLQGFDESLAALERLSGV